MHDLILMSNTLPTVLLQGLPAVATAAANLDGATADVAKLGASLLRLSLVISSFLISSNQGGQGIQRYVRGAFLTLGLGAFFLTGYSDLTTQSMALF